jgi:hypothetical protein
MSNKISVGTSGEVAMQIIPQPGREKFQTFIGSIHTHPIDHGLDFRAYGLSDEDYRIFLSDLRQQFMVITFGDSVRMLVMKTSVSPNNLEQESIKKRILDITAEFFAARVSPTQFLAQFVDFNKTVCVEFGLTFYMANKESNDLFERISVAG